MLLPQTGGRLGPTRPNRASHAALEPGSRDQASGLLGHHGAQQLLAGRPATVGTRSSPPSSEVERASLARRAVANLAALCSRFQQRPFAGTSDLTLSQLRL